MKKLFLIALSVGLMTACGDHDHSHEGHDHGNHEGHDHGDSDENKGTLNFYGENFDPTGAVEITEVLSKMEGEERVDFIFKGKINETCAHRGCWMTVDTPDEGEMTIFMGDHTFFVPKSEADGLDCFVKGTAFQDTISVEQQKHWLEQDEASQEEIDAITDIITEVAFTATGVIIDGYEGDETGNDHDHSSCGHDHSKDHEHEHDDHDHEDHEGHTH